MHHGFNYIDQFEGIVETRDPQIIETSQPIPPEPEEQQEPQQGNVFQGYVANEEENENIVVKEIRNVAEVIIENTFVNQQVQQAQVF